MSTIQTSPLLKGVFGASMVGVMLSAVVFGLLTMQVWTYFHKYPRDKVWIKCLVALAWTIEAFQIATTTHMVYYYLVLHFGLFADLSVASWDYCLYLGQVSAAAIIAELFFVRRLFVLAHHWALRWVICAIIVTLGLLSFSIGIFIMGRALELKTFAAFAPYTWAVDLWLGAASAADLLVAISMCYYLHKSRTGIKSTDHLINRLMAYSMQTGALTSLTELFCLITYTVTGFHYGHIVLIFPVGGFYATSLLANLNARHSQVAQSLNSTTHVFELSEGTSNGRSVTKVNNKGVGVVDITKAATDPRPKGFYEQWGSSMKFADVAVASTIGSDVHNAV